MFLLSLVCLSLLLHHSPSFSFFLFFCVIEYILLSFFFLSSAFRYWRCLCLFYSFFLSFYFAFAQLKVFRSRFFLLSFFSSLFEDLLLASLLSFSLYLFPSVSISLFSFPWSQILIASSYPTVHQTIFFGLELLRQSWGQSDFDARVTYTTFWA